MSTKVFFCDTYALIEIVGGNPNYQQYLDEVLITSDLNLMELYYAFLRDYDERTAKKYLKFWTQYSIALPRDTISNAMNFKLANKRDNLSYVDCMGYIFCVENKIMFLTGDIKFENMKNVEYVK